MKKFEELSIINKRQAKVFINGEDFSLLDNLIRSALIFNMEISSTNIGHMVMDGEEVDTRMVAMLKRRNMFIMLEVIDGVIHDRSVPLGSDAKVSINNYDLGLDLIKILQQSIMNYKHHKGRGPEVVAGLLKIHNALEAVRTHP